jgi:hypothetical protein
VPEDTAPLELAAVIDAVRAELVSAAARGAGEPLQFEVQEVTLELEVSVTTSKEAEGGLKVWVLAAGGKAGRAATSTHRISLKLTATDDAGNRYRVSDVQRTPVPRG